MRGKPSRPHHTDPNNTCARCKELAEKSHRLETQVGDLNLQISELKHALGKDREELANKVQEQSAMIVRLHEVLRSIINQLNLVRSSVWNTERTLEISELTAQEAMDLLLERAKYKSSR